MLLRALIRELEWATRPLVVGDVVVAWRQVQHPAIVQRLLGSVVVDGEVIEAVAEDGCLTDPEAAGYALDAARRVLSAGERGESWPGWPWPDGDLVVDAYVAAVRDRDWRDEG